MIEAKRIAADLLLRKSLNSQWAGTLKQQGGAKHGEKGKDRKDETDPRDKRAETEPPRI
jgi:hypothetical protein